MDRQNRQRDKSTERIDRQMDRLMVGQPSIEAGEKTQKLSV
jgi:hypothetical protein